MKIGDLIQSKVFPKSLLVVESINQVHGIANCYPITDKTGHINQIQTIKALQITINSQTFNQIAWAGKECQQILGVNPVPHWVHLLMANVVHGGNKQTSQQKLYPLGAIILGTSSAGNVWIVTQDQSREISLVWDGKHAKWCGSEYERPDAIATEPPIAAFDDAITYINSKLHTTHHITYKDFPRWAMDLYNGQQGVKVAPQTIAQYKNDAAAVPKEVMERLAESGVSHKKIEIQPPKRAIDTLRETCHHRFLPYHGFREVYEFCANCDKTRAVKK